MYYEVAVASSFGSDGFWTYGDGGIENIPIGSLVVVEAGKKLSLGFVIRKSDCPEYKVKDILFCLDFIIIPNSYLRFIVWMSWYTVTDLSLLVSLTLSGLLDIILDLYSSFSSDLPSRSSQINMFDCVDSERKVSQSTSLDELKSEISIVIDDFLNSRRLSSAKRRKDLIASGFSWTDVSLPVKPIDEVSYESPVLSEAQDIAFKNILKYIVGFNPILLDGVTGSGKTLIYVNAIKHVLSLDKKSQVLILLPEIVLVNQISEYMKKFFDHDIIVEWHSCITKKHKRSAWINVLLNSGKIIIGTRSALLLPYNNLSLIIIDEEHDSSYKQEEGSILYNARDMAIVRAKLSNIPVLLGSATPSLDSMYNVECGKYQRVELSTRFGQGVLPKITYIDMKGMASKTWISSEMYDLMKKYLNKGDQVGLFLNRRGYAPVNLCKDCGYKVECLYCSVFLIEHRKGEDKYLLCHYCGYKSSIPEICNDCGSCNSFIPYGPGVDRIAEEVAKQLSDYKCVVLSSDVITSKKSTVNIMQDIHEGKYDIIIGTQIISKGHNFKNMNLIGIIDADLAGMGSDLRSAEQTYQLLTQVSGRSGRFSDRGVVVLQTYNCNSVFIQSLLNNDRDLFYKNEMLSRQSAKMPPFTKVASLIMSSSNKIDVESFSSHLISILPKQNDIDIMGPVFSIMERVKNMYRMKILLRSKENKSLSNYIISWKDKIIIPNNILFKIDIDPHNLL